MTTLEFMNVLDKDTSVIILAKGGYKVSGTWKEIMYDDSLSLGNQVKLITPCGEHTILIEEFGRSQSS